MHANSFIAGLAAAAVGLSFAGQVEAHRRSVKPGASSIKGAPAPYYVEVRGAQ